ncbi:MAG: hypothetical protein KBF17_07760 [Candidatus Promineofilum sp.]|nr:hypothetical protein [Promineifilum sp.]
MNYTELITAAAQNLGIHEGDILAVTIDNAKETITIITWNFAKSHVPFPKLPKTKKVKAIKTE